MEENGGEGAAAADPISQLVSATSQLVSATSPPDFTDDPFFQREFADLLRNSPDGAQYGAPGGVKDGAPDGAQDPVYQDLRVIRIEETDQHASKASEHVKRALRAVKKSILEKDLEGVTMTFESYEDIQKKYKNLLKARFSFVQFGTVFLTGIKWENNAAFNQFRDLFLNKYGTKRWDIAVMWHRIGFAPYIVKPDGAVVINPQQPASKKNPRQDPMTMKVFDCTGLTLCDDPAWIQDVKDRQSDCIQRAKDSKRRKTDDASGALGLLAGAALQDFNTAAAQASTQP